MFTNGLDLNYFKTVLHNSNKRNMKKTNIINILKANLKQDAVKCKK